MVKSGKIRFERLRDENSPPEITIYDSYDEFLESHPYDTFKAFCQDKNADAMWIKSGDAIYKLSKQTIRLFE